MFLEYQIIILNHLIFCLHEKFVLSSQESSVQSYTHTQNLSINIPLTNTKYVSQYTHFPQSLFPSVQ